MDNSKCTKCEKTFTENDNIVYCPTCGAYYHIDCWNENGGCANKECADYVEPPVYAWSNHEIPKEKQKITIKGPWYQTTSAIFSFFMAIVSIASLVMCLLAVPIFGNDSIELAFAIIFGVSLSSYPIFFGSKLCKYLIKKPTKTKNGKMAKKISLLVLFPILELAVAILIVMLSLLIFTCTFTHSTYTVDSENECYVEYRCTKCDVIQYDCSEKSESCPIHHTYKNGKCIFCEKDAKEYFIALIKTIGQESLGAYEFSEVLEIDSNNYSITIEYDETTEGIYISMTNSSKSTSTVLEIDGTSTYKWLHAETVSGKTKRAVGEISASDLESGKVTVSETNVTNDAEKTAFVEASAKYLKKLTSAINLCTQKYYFTFSNLSK